MQNSLQSKKILLGITGGIAAYKSAELVSLLKKSGAEVRVMMTAAAEQFVTSITFAALSGHKVFTNTFDAEVANAMPHIELAKWSDLIMIAPATANIIAELAQGLANNIISTTCLAANKSIPLIIAPAMNCEMWEQESTQQNIEILRSQNKIICGPALGSQACGDYGMGRMEEPGVLLQTIEKQFLPKLLADTKILITAGPTREAIDPVRYISNHSSGKMGYAIAEAARQMGAEVTLISGPTALSCSQHIKRINVISAQEMLNTVLDHIHNQDIFIATAAVADYRLDQPFQEKIKKKSDTLNLNLVKNPDILKAVSTLTQRPSLVGFAAETSKDNLINYAKQKLIDKNLNIIIANVVSETQGFNQDTNEATIITAQEIIPIPSNSKKELAEQLISFIAKRIKKP